MANHTAWAHSVSSTKDSVHLGTWINWSRGRVMGATLTLNRIEGNLLIAFTAVFVGIVTERFWRISCILFYRFRSSPEPNDGLYHQHQAVLRNSSSTVSAIWTITQLLWAWHNVAKRCFIRVLPTLLTAIFCLGAFTVAGGFSSSISSGISDEVLLNGSKCGVVQYISTDADSSRINAPRSSQVIHSAANYAQQCYSPDSAGTFDSAGIFDCKYFVKDHLLSTVDEQAGCPFGDSICRSNDSNIRLDTGYLSLLHDLGVNSPPDQDILFRKVLHCAPLETQGYTESVLGISDNFTSYNYGPLSSGPNYTYMAETLDSQYKKQSGNPFRGSSSNFILHARFSPVHDGKILKTPLQYLTIPALFSPDKDTNLIFLSGNGVEFYERTNDPWYHATTPGSEIDVSDSDEGHFSVYQPDEAASPLGCTEQFQFCNPSLPRNRCGPLASLYDVQVKSAPLFGMTATDFENTSAIDMHGTMISRYQWLCMIIVNASTSIANLVNSLGPNSLDSPKYLINGLMGSLPDDQWQLDVKYWWTIYLASLQEALVDTARGTTDPGLDPYKLLPFNSDVQAMCNNQKIRSTRHVSFSLFGLYFTFVTGLLIILISYALEPIFQCLYHRRKYKEYTYLEWAASETLQLQRIGFEGINAGTWSGCADPIPTTKPGEILTSLALRSSPDAQKDLKFDGTPDTTNSNTTTLTHRVSQDQEADLASLDDLLEGSAYPNSDSPGAQVEGTSEQIGLVPQSSQ